MKNANNNVPAIVTGMKKKLQAAKKEIAALKKQAKGNEKQAIAALNKQATIFDIRVNTGLDMVYATIVYDNPKIVIFNKFGLLIDVLKGMTIHPLGWSRSKGHCNLKGQSEYGKILDVLRANDIEYITGNDAPKGGQAGRFIRLKNDDDRKIEHDLFVANFIEKCTVDQIFIDSCILEKNLSGMLKNNSQQKSFASLLVRNGLKLDSKDFWYMYKAIKENLRKEGKI